MPTIYSRKKRPHKDVIDCRIDNPDFTLVFRRIANALQRISETKAAD